MSTIDPRNRQWNERTETFVRLYRAGASAASIGQAHGVTDRTVYRILAAAGEQRSRPRPARELATVDEALLSRVRELIAEGMPERWIMETLAVSRRTVAKVSRTMPGRELVRREVQPIWQSIARTPELAALHREFSPKVANPD